MKKTEVVILLLALIAGLLSGMVFSTGREAPFPPTSMPIQGME